LLALLEICSAEGESLRFLDPVSVFRLTVPFCWSIFVTVPDTVDIAWARGLMTSMSYTETARADQPGL
jgi:hypothetical protein